MVGLSQFVPDSNGKRRLNGSGNAVPEIRHPYSGVTTRGVSVVPESRKSLTPEFRTSRGGRVGGGGTSNEALRRAKKKARSAKSTLRQKK